MQERYRSLASWLRRRFGERVHKISLDVGLGCPHRRDRTGPGGCIFCNTRGSGTAASMRGESLESQLDSAMLRLNRRYQCRKFIAYFQSFSNTYADPLTLADLFQRALRPPEIVGLAVGTRPDCVPESVLEVLEPLARRKLVWLEYGLQSAHAGTLELINRGHTPDAFYDAVARTRARSIPVVAHVILGLPGERLHHMRETARVLGRIGVNGVKLHPLYIIRDTPLESMFRRGEYLPMTEEEAQAATISFLRTIPASMVVHRLTSDPHADELVAPHWMLDRHGVRRRLLDAMDRGNVHQGMDENPGGYLPVP